MPDNPQCLSFFDSGHDVMDSGEHLRQAMALIRCRYDFRRKSGIAFHKQIRPGVPGAAHGFGDDVPKCDFCIWLAGFADAAATDRAAAEAKLAEVSYRCGTLFFSAPDLLGRPASEMVLRHTKYEHALDIGSVDGHSVFMCW